MASKSSPRVTAEMAREFLRQSAELGSWSTAYAQKILGVDSATARDALKVLETSGYIEHAPGSKSDWRNSTAGNAAVGVSNAKPVKRATAEKKLAEMLQRVQQVNEDPQRLYRVARVVVFGPYLAKDAEIKDIDVAVELTPKQKDKEKHQKLATERADAAAAAGKKFKSHAARRDYARTEVLEFLKGRTRALSLREVDDWVLAQPHKAVG